MLQEYKEAVEKIYAINDLYALLAAGNITDEQLLALAAWQGEHYNGQIAPDVGRMIEKRMLWQCLQDMFNPHLACR
jgi:hypothetical protein